jgi:hypothetical protein
MAFSQRHTHIVQFPVTDGADATIAVELPAELQGSAPAGIGADGKSAKSFADAVDGIRPIADSVMAAVNGVRAIPSEVTVEFAVRLNAKLGLALVSAGSEASMRVQLTWRPPGG